MCARGMVLVYKVKPPGPHLLTENGVRLCAGTVHVRVSTVGTLLPGAWLQRLAFVIVSRSVFPGTQFSPSAGTGSKKPETLKCPAASCKLKPLIHFQKEIATEKPPSRLPPKPQDPQPQALLAMLAPPTLPGKLLPPLTRTAWSGRLSPMEPNTGDISRPGMERPFRHVRGLEQTTFQA